MRTAAVLLALLTGSAPLRGGADAQAVHREEAPTTPAADAGLPRPSLPVVTVKSRGKRPFHVLRWRFEEGARRTLTITLDMSASLTVDSLEGPSSRSPTVVHTLEVEVENVASDGDALLGFVVTRSALGDGADLDPEAAAQMQGALDSIVGIRGMYRHAARGFVSDVRIDIPSGPTPLVRQLLEHLRQSLQQTAAPLPERRIGRGAKWQVDATIDLGGILVTRTEVFRAVRLRHPRLDVEIRTRQQGGEQAIIAPGWPEEERPQLISLRSTGRGNARWNLDEPAPVRADLLVSLEMHLRVRDESAREHDMTMSMQTDMRMSSDPSSISNTRDDFDVAAVQAKIKTHQWRIRACYEDELSRNGALSGKIVMEFQVEGTGRVSRAEPTENTTGSDAMAACIANELLLFRFDPGPEDGSVIFKYPFVFEPAQE